MALHVAQRVAAAPTMQAAAATGGHMHERGAGDAAAARKKGRGRTKQRENESDGAFGRRPGLFEACPALPRRVDVAASHPWHTRGPPGPVTDATSCRAAAQLAHNPQPGPREREVVSFFSSQAMSDRAECGKVSNRSPRSPRASDDLKTTLVYVIHVSANHHVYIHTPVSTHTRTTHLHHIA